MNQHRPSRPVGGRAHPSGHASRAFTLSELIVVMAVIVLLLGVAVPSITAMLKSNARAQAAEALRAGLVNGRIAALRSAAGSDGAVVFLASATGRVSMVACERVGAFRDFTTQQNGLGPAVERDVFVPVPGIEPVELPQGWSVRALAAPGTAGPGNTDVNLGWYEGAHHDDTSRNWVFPETSLNDPADEQSGVFRQSFIVRFDGGTGALSPDQAEALVFIPSTSGQLRQNDPFDFYKLEQAEDAAAAIRRLLADDRLLQVSGFGGANSYQSDITSILGDESPDTVLARPVRLLVLYEERELANALRQRLDPITNTIYVDPLDDPDAGPTLVDATIAADDITAWLEGDTNGDGTFIIEDDGTLTDDKPRTRMYTIEAASGRVVELPLVPLDAAEGSS